MIRRTAVKRQGRIPLFPGVDWKGAATEADEQPADLIRFSDFSADASGTLEVSLPAKEVFEPFCYPCPPGRFGVVNEFASLTGSNPVPKLIEHQVSLYDRVTGVNKEGKKLTAPDSDCKIFSDISVGKSIPGKSPVLLAPNTKDASGQRPSYAVTK